MGERLIPDPIELELGLDIPVDLPADCTARSSQLREQAAVPLQTPWPSFSIVVPTFQRRNVVCDTVRAISQTRYSGSVELIVVVDGSTDGTLEALRSIACPFPIRIVGQQNEGASRARNRGAAQAVHDVILFLDDDMIAEPDLVQEHGRLYLQGVDAVIGDVTIHPGSPPGFLPHSVARGVASSPVRTPLTPFDILTGQLSVRRSEFRRLGGFDPALTSRSAFGNEDADFGIRLLAQCDVRYCRNAKSRQLYVVTPRQYMQRAARAATADLEFARKHPEFAERLFELKGATRPLTRFVYWPLSRIPFMADWLGAVAVRLAERAQKTPFRTNRVLARFFSGARATLYWSALRARGWPRTSRHVLVLCYHAIGDFSDDPVLAPYSVPRKLFVEHLDSLRERAYTFIDPDELAALLSAGAPVPKRSVLLTFDDGYSEHLEIAREELADRGIKSVVFAVTGLETNEWDRRSGGRTLGLLGPEEHRLAAAFGIEIGSHSRTHQLLPKLSDIELTAEIEGSVEELAARGLPRPRFFAYPYGARNEACLKAVEKAGFLAAFGPRQSRVSSGSPIFDLPRVHIVAADRGWRFRAKTACPSAFAWSVRVTDAIRRRLPRLERSRRAG